MYVCLSVCLLTSVATAEWVELTPIDGGDVMADQGSCCAASNDFVVVSVAGGDEDVFAYRIATDSWEDVCGYAVTHRAGAMAFEHGDGRRFFLVTDGDDGTDCQLHTLWVIGDDLEDWAWNDEEEPLPDTIGPGVGLAFVPARRSNVALSGHLYLLCGGNSRDFFRRRFDRRYDIPWIAGPMDGAQTKPDYTALDWRITSASATYDVQVDNSAGFGSPEVDTTVTCGELVIPNGKLSSYTTYYWRVRSTEGARTSGWSDVESFVTSATSATGGYSTFPPDDAEIAGDETYFDWPSVAYATAYELVVKPTTSGTPVLDETLAVSEYSSTDKLDCGDYQWKYRSKNRFNVWSSWSSWYDVDVDHVWVARRPIPSANPVNTGGALCFGRKDASGDDTCLYAFVGGGSSEFWRYDPPLDTWVACDTTLGRQKGGASLAAGGNRRLTHALLGTGYDTHRLYKWYRPQAPWDSADAPLPQDCDYGSGITHNNTNPYLVVAGNDEHNFYRWDGLDEEQEDEYGGSSGSCGSPLAASVNRSPGGVGICFALRKPGRVRATVVDAAGRVVVVLADGDRPAGIHHVVWNRGSTPGSRTAAGVYFVRLETPDGRATLKAVLER